MAWTEVVPIAGERGFVVDSQGIYHDEPGLIFHRGLRFIGQAVDGRIFWNVLVAEWTVLAVISAYLIYFCRSKRSPNVPAAPQIGCEQQRSAYCPGVHRYKNCGVGGVRAEAMSTLSRLMFPVGVAGAWA